VLKYSSALLKTPLGEEDGDGPSSHIVGCVNQLGKILYRKLDQIVGHHKRRDLVAYIFHTLLEVLKGHDKVQGGGEAGNRSMVFIQTRMSCRCIYDYLSLLPEWKGRVGMMVGQSSETGPALHEVPDCSKTLQAFRDGKIEVRQMPPQQVIC